MYLSNFCLCCSLIFLCYGAAFAYKKTADQCKSPGYPIIFVPGDGGSQIQATLNKTEVVHYICRKQSSGYFDLWLNLELLLPVVLDCFIDNMRLVYNATTGATSDSPGVTTRVPGWGNTSTVEWLDPSQNRVGHYFASIVQKAVSMGYRKGKNLRGAPYDFRKAPNEMQLYYQKLKALIEETYYANGNCPVVTIGHSMGNPVMLYFLNRQKQSWKNKFIKSHVSISAPWGGCIKIMLLLASGYNLDHWSLLLNPLKMRSVQRSMPSTPFLVPSDKFWAANESIVVTPQRNYTVKDFHQFYKDIKFESGWPLFQQTSKLVYDMTPPGIELHCLYGVGIETPDVLVYGKGQFPDSQPSQLKGDGDGTVNIRSLEGCMRWKGQQPQAVYNASFVGQEHLDILKSPDVVNYIEKVLQS